MTNAAALAVDRSCQRDVLLARQPHFVPERDTRQSQRRDQKPECGQLKRRIAFETDLDCWKRRSPQNQGSGQRDVHSLFVHQLEILECGEESIWRSR
jgi:hypothetical protein